MRILFMVFSAVILFLLTGFLGKQMYHHKDTLFKYSVYSSYSGDDQSLSGNFILKTFFPSVFIVVLAWLLQILKLELLAYNIWLVVAFYWVIRLIWLLIIFNLSSLTNFTYELTSLIISICTSAFVYFIFIEYCLQNGISVFLTRDELRSGVAFALLLYLINIVWKVLNSNGLFSRSNIYNDTMIINDLHKRTNKLIKRYGSFVSKILMECLNEDQRCDKEYFVTKILFAIMIVEDRNRPYIIRKVENLLHITLMKGKPMSVGIMQVKSTSNLSDEQSIREAINIILSVIDEDTNDPYHYTLEDSAIVTTICQRYNPSYEYAEEVEFIEQNISEWLDFVHG